MSLLDFCDTFTKTQKKVPLKVNPNEILPHGSEHKIKDPNLNLTLTDAPCWPGADVSCQILVNVDVIKLNVTFSLCCRENKG